MFETTFNSVSFIKSKRSTGLFLHFFFFFASCSSLFILNSALAACPQFISNAIKFLCEMEADSTFNQFCHFEVLELCFYYTCSVVTLKGDAKLLQYTFEWMQKLQRCLIQPA